VLDKNSSGDESERELLRSAPRKLPEFAEITQNNAITPFKVTDFGTNRKLIYDFLLVINSNLPPILYRFRDIAVYWSKIAILGYPSCLTPPAEFPWDDLREIFSGCPRVATVPSAVEILTKI